MLVRTVYLSANYLRMIKPKIHLQKQLPHDLDLLKQTKSIPAEFISQTTAACCILNTIGAEEKYEVQILRNGRGRGDTGHMV